MTRRLLGLCCRRLLVGIVCKMERCALMGGKPYPPPTNCGAKESGVDCKPGPSDCWAGVVGGCRGNRLADGPAWVAVTREVP